MTEALYYTTHTSSIGDLLLVASPRGVRFITLLKQGDNAQDYIRTHFATPPSPTIMELAGFFESACKALDAYLNSGTELDLPYDLVGGTPLQRAVWLAIAKIPYGETVSYTELAEQVQFPRAIRAVASACGANPIPLLIPCHRVVAKDGSLGGFSLGGVHIKQQLLALEGRRIEAAAA